MDKKFVSSPKSPDLVSIQPPHSHLVLILILTADLLPPFIDLRKDSFTLYVMNVNQFELFRVNFYSAAYLSVLILK
jgi:hypothetical protein